MWIVGVATICDPEIVSELSTTRDAAAGKIPVIAKPAPASPGCAASSSDGPPSELSPPPPPPPQATVASASASPSSRIDEAIDAGAATAMPPRACSGAAGCAMLYATRPVRIGTLVPDGSGLHRQSELCWCLTELAADVRDHLGVARALHDLRHLGGVARHQILAPAGERVAPRVVQREERTLCVDEILHHRKNRPRSRRRHRARRVAERELPALAVADVERDTAHGVDAGLHRL